MPDSVLPEGSGQEFTFKILSLVLCLVQNYKQANKNRS